MDTRGRIADQAILTALGWTPGTGLDIEESGNRLVIRPNEGSVPLITKRAQ